MTRPKNKRTQPERVFENYVAHFASAPHLGTVDVEDRAMTLTKNVRSTASGITTNTYSDITNIGFNFKFDGLTYTKFVTVLDGTVILLDPAFTGSTFSSTEWSDINTNSPSTNSEYGWRTSGFNGNQQHVVLCPYTTAGAGSYNAGAPYPNLRSLNSTTFANNLPRTIRMLYGLQPPIGVYNHKHWGIRYLTQDSHEGRRTIIRYNAFTSPTDSNAARSKFDVVLYENGKIEFRYEPRNKATSISDGYANCMILLSGTSTRERFRDMSIELGYKVEDRERYALGGWTGNSSWSDSPGSTPYGLLRASYNWPSNFSWGSVITFSPPSNAVRDPARLLLNQREQNTSYPITERNVPIGTSMYDDSLTILFNSGVVVNAPSMNQRFYGGNTSSDVINRQSKFTTLDLTGTISRTSNDSFIFDHRKLSYVAPFGENKNHDYVEDDEFFASGTLPLSQPLKSKTQIVFSLPVDIKTKMPEYSSSIYYFSPTINAWMVPQNTSYVLTGYQDFVPPPGYERGDWQNPSASARVGSVLNDMRGFGPIGNYVASGTTNVSFTRENLIDALIQEYTSSICVSQDYRANENETFYAPITRPFLLEKAIIDIPLEMGPGWFSDRTTTFSPITTGSQPFGRGFDFAGPAITIALFHETAVGTTTVRNLILSGTITHLYDNTQNFVLSNFSPVTTDSTYYYARPEGFLAYEAEPTAIVSPTADTSYFTGSVTLKCEPQISNGAMLLYRRDFNGDSTSNKDAILSLMSQSTLKLSDHLPYLTMSYLNPLGRAGTGFTKVGGRSLIQECLLPSASIVSNPFYKDRYVSSGTFSSSIDTALNGTFSASLMATIPYLKFTTSPYLITPGDRLILAVAKMRPFFYDTISISNRASGSVAALNGHDVGFNTGSIKLSFYGSYLQAGNEKHDTLNQPLQTVAIHEVSIGADPVIDQHQIESSYSFAGSTNDDYITGSLVTIVRGTNGQNVLLTGSRTRLFSKTLRNFENRSYETRATVQNTPWYWSIGSSHFNQAQADDEDYYDTMVPSFSECTRINGGVLKYWDERNVAIVSLSNQGTSFSDDKTWMRSFPLEPRYASVQRTLGLNQTYITRKKVSGPEDTPSADNVRTFNGLTIHVYVGNNNAAMGDYLIFGDMIGDVTSSLSNTDTAKVLYGFGDGYWIDNGDLYGSNYMPMYYTTQTEEFGRHLALVPMIRGWKYGLLGGLPTKTTSYWSNKHYGYLRDMLEQRPMTKFLKKGKPATAAVTVRFVTPSGKLTKPENTWSSNLSHEATSSVPYFDGETRNRSDLNVNTLNQGIVTFTTDNGNVTL